MEPAPAPGAAAPRHPVAPVSNTVVGRLMVSSDMDIVTQTRMFASMDPRHQQFIPTPGLNAGQDRKYTYNNNIKCCVQDLCPLPQASVDKKQVETDHKI